MNSQTSSNKSVMQHKLVFLMNYEIGHQINLRTIISKHRKTVNKKRKGNSFHTNFLTDIKHDKSSVKFFKGQNRNK